MIQSLNVKQKQSANLSLKLWLPLLQSSLQELEKHLTDVSGQNPFLKVTPPKKTYIQEFSSQSGEKSTFIDNFATDQKSLYETLIEQIDAPLFPTEKSRKVAMQIVDYISEEGYFEGDIGKIAVECEVYNDFVEKVRKRFVYLEPSGVGAVNMEESFLFQLSDFEMSEGVHDLLKTMIKNIKRIDKYASHHYFNEAKEIIKKLKNPPAVSYVKSAPSIIPDCYIDVEDEIEIRMNGSFYPDLSIKDSNIAKNDELKVKLKEARDLVNLLDLRKATLYKIMLVIVERQIGFFVGGELKPLTMQEVADALGFSEPTVSRAVSNKYIDCKRGVFPIKKFFTNAVTKNLSSDEIKNFIKSLIEYENENAPLTDQEIVEKIAQRFRVTLVRRTVTKYRKLLSIPSSKERKKIYKVV